MTFTSNVRRSIPSFKDRNPGSCPSLGRAATRPCLHLSDITTGCHISQLMACQRCFTSTELPCDSKGEYDCRSPPDEGTDSGRKGRRMGIQVHRPPHTTKSEMWSVCLPGTVLAVALGGPPSTGGHRVYRPKTPEPPCLQGGSLCPPVTPTGESGGERTC